MERVMNGGGHVQRPRREVVATAAARPRGQQLFSPAPADLNGDGKVDVAGAGRQSTSVKVFPGNGDGSLAGPITTTTGGPPISVVVADFNGDGRPDAAATGSNNVWALLNDRA
jgi:hypothetical protein